MKKSFWIIAIVAFIFAMAGCGGAKSEAEAVKDKQVDEQPSVGNEDKSSGEEKSQEPRVIATTVAVTQIMDALGVELVGIPTSVKTLPERYKTVTKVGNPMSPDMELVKSLKPTEVLSVTTLKYDLEPVFENVGVKASFLDLTSLADMQAAIVDLGKRYGKEEQANTIAEGYDAKIAEMAAREEGKQKPTVLILLGVPGSYLVATENSYIGDLVRLAGGVNIVQGETVEYLASNTEYLQQANPDVILRAAHGMPEEVVKMFDKEFKKNDIWKHFNAVQNNRVYDLEEALFGTTASLAASDALDALMEMLYL